MTKHIKFNNTLETIKKSTVCLVNKETGETLECLQVKKTISSAKSFWKVYLNDFLHIIGIIYSKQLEILVYILENTSGSTNLFLGTYMEICKEVKVSQPTIATLMKKLQTNGFIKKIRGGVWAINANIMVRGNQAKQNMLVSYHSEHSDKQKDKIGSKSPFEERNEK